MNATPDPVVTIIRPQLTPEEREARMNELKRAVADFWVEVEKSKKTRLEVHYHASDD